MNKEEKEAIEKLEFFKETGYATFMIKYDVDRTTANGMIKRTIETVLNLIQKQDKIIDNAIKEVEKIRCYFGEDVQVEFIRVLEILKDKNVKDW